MAFPALSSVFTINDTHSLLSSLPPAHCFQLLGFCLWQFLMFKIFHTYSKNIECFLLPSPAGS